MQGAEPDAGDSAQILEADGVPVVLLDERASELGHAVPGAGGPETVRLPSAQGVPDPGHRARGNVRDTLTERVQLWAGVQIDHRLPQGVQAFRVTLDRADLMRMAEPRR